MALQTMRMVGSRGRGFTLIEIMMVVALGLLLMGWGIPNMLRFMEKHGISKAVNDVVEGCRHARAYAILVGVPAELVIEAEGGISVRRASGSRLLPSQGGAPEDPAPAGSSRNEKLKHFHRQLDDDIAIESVDVNFKNQMEYSEAAVRFYPNGSSDEFTITLRRDDEWRMVSLDPITGLPQMENVKNLR